MEATCQYRETTILKHVGVGSTVTHEYVCGAPIPRLDDGSCANCQHDKALHDEGEAWCDACWQFPRMGAELCAYLGPLASECEKDQRIKELEAALLACTFWMQVLGVPVDGDGEMAKSLRYTLSLLPAPETVETQGDER